MCNAYETDTVRELKWKIKQVEFRLNDHLLVQLRYFYVEQVLYIIVQCICIPYQKGHNY